MSSDPTPLKPGNPKPWNDPRVRSVAFQLIAIAAVAWIGYSLFQNTISNMESRGIRTGFGFLNETAGFGIIMSLIDYNETMTYARTFLVGLTNTLLVSGLGILFATIVGFIVGIARLSTNWLVAKLALAYIEIFRNVPLLLQIFFWYFAVLGTLPGPRQALDVGGVAFLSNRGIIIPRPVFEAGAGWIGIALIIALIASAVMVTWARRRQAATGRIFPAFPLASALILGLPALAYFVMGRPVGWDIPAMGGFNFSGGITAIPELGALLLALTIYTATFIAEIVRSGIVSVSSGQTEAALALGLPPRRVLRLVVIPQALRVIIPPLTSQYLNLTKNSSLAVAIGYPDLVNVFMGTSLNQTGQAVEIVAMTMAVYLAISLSISLLMNIYNRAVALKER
ncbi:MULTISPECIES: amino acid ABC transporter permease [Spiribacter]|jgi:general L-amino acid transport system permease protein|uniref:Amino acid ABC transporter permease n=2 Tax=Spiribacter TaxID=1335745 RepID=A0A557RFI8_9GAMM|nr:MULTISPECIES: amino acid ABC transporter permease [Spiribacter]AUB78530.1 amino acid ABC transporter permease [Spiribacter roseus]KAF0280490.1 amino acid ABC transporter permease [Spiribacter roseus]KAF0282787.1 amino acid ABC transporter permease [Spiribacter roseus]KAF0284099.1 amino acid ABC transporter permease [Spiribacter roseus]KAF0285508.1 amino acid ABC transporter permease [Spiribacter sp. SSL99]